MSDQVTGQALVNSHTFWGILLTAASGSGMTQTILPFVTTALAANGVPNAPAVVQALTTLAGVAWALYGRKNASAPITGLVKP